MSPSSSSESGIGSSSGSFQRSAEYFRRVSDDYSRYSRWTRSADLVAAEFEILRGAAEAGLTTVVDIGAGTGDYLQLVADSGMFGDARLIALDSSSHMLSQRSVQDSPVHRILGDMHCLPFIGSAVDRVIGRQVLHYVDTDKALAEVRRLLRPDGVFHSTQQVDYDEPSDEWYESWSALRGAPMRRRLSDARLTDAVARVGLTEVARRYVFLRLGYTWIELARKYGRSDDPGVIRHFFDRSPEAVLNRFDFAVSDEGVEYTSRFRVSAFAVPRG